ncbi:hypothetical protein SAMD00019534_041700, partial [Acytostelium subglobosum LB1]|uniref:hypothetical protein n=1 Tax=Acytostelium subglobosum LB1 TaxID=1410327 RepID=UPI00064494AD
MYYYDQTVKPRANTHTSASSSYSYPYQNYSTAADTSAMVAGDMLGSSPQPLPIVNSGNSNGSSMHNQPRVPRKRSTSESGSTPNSSSPASFNKRYGGGGGGAPPMYHKPHGGADYNVMGLPPHHHPHQQQQQQHMPYQYQYSHNNNGHADETEPAFFTELEKELPKLMEKYLGENDSVFSENRNQRSAIYPILKEYLKDFNYHTEERRRHPDSTQKTRWQEIAEKLFSITLWSWNEYRDNVFDPSKPQHIEELTKLREKSRQREEKELEDIITNYLSIR